MIRILICSRNFLNFVLRIFQRLNFYSELAVISIFATVLNCTRTVFYFKFFFHLFLSLRKVFQSTLPINLNFETRKSIRLYTNVSLFQALFKLYFNLSNGASDRLFHAPRFKRSTSYFVLFLRSSIFLTNHTFLSQKDTTRLLLQGAILNESMIGLKKHRNTAIIKAQHFTLKYNNTLFHKNSFFNILLIELHKADKTTTPEVRFAFYKHL